MAVSKVELGGETLIDISGDTVTPETLVVGVTAHDASGKKIEGKFDTSIFQTKEDESLNTDDKTVVGAINGINTDLITLMAWYDKENYISLAFKDGSISPTYTNTTLEMRPSTRAYSVTFSWQFNKTPTSLTVGGTSTATGTTSYTKSFYSTTEGSQVFSVVGKYSGDYGEEEAKRDWTFAFRNKVYYGAKSGDSITATEILNLSRSNFATNYKNTGFNLNDSSADKYVWYCFPSRFETSKVPTFTVGGFEGAFIKYGTVSFTNSSGYTEDYSVYRSTNKGVGDSTITVS